MNPVNQPEDSIAGTSQGESSLSPSDRELMSRYIESKEINPADLDLIPSQSKPLNLAERQEVTRSKLATYLIGILAGTIVASFLLIIGVMTMTVFIDKDKSENLDKTSTLVKDLVTLIITAQTGLIGTALGFYFSSTNNNYD